MVAATMRLFLYTSLLLLPLIQQATQNEDTVEDPSIVPESYSFLADGKHQPRSAPVSLGTDVHQCLGNVARCYEGFTLLMWIEPARRSSSVPHRYVLSSGGQSSMSTGFYVRQNYGKEYEIGVAMGTNLWTTSLHLADGRGANLAVTWSVVSGLEVFVDGFRAATDKTGKTRVFTNPSIDPFTDIVAGKANDDVTATPVEDVALWNVTFWSQKLLEPEIAAVVEVDTRSLLVGSLAAVPENAPAAANESVDVLACRRHCAESGRQLAVHSPGAGCRCMYVVDFIVDENLGGGEGNVSNSERKKRSVESAISGQDGQWHVYWATHYVTSVTYPIELAVDVRYATDKPYVRPNETVTFSMTTTSDEDVTFYVDFNDGIKLVTSHGVVSHAWQRDGTYRVNVTAVTRVARETVEKTVQIEWVEEGVKPEMVAVQGNSLPESCAVRIYLTAVSVYEKTCELDLGDDTKQELGKKDEMIYEDTRDHTYDGIGFYDIRLRCQNDYGVTEHASQVIASHPVIEYESQARYTDVHIPVVGADVNAVVVIVDGELTNFTTAATGVTIAGSQFSYSGEHVIRVETAAGEGLLTKVFNLQEEVGEITIVPSPRETRVNSSILLEFAIDAGDHVHVRLDYGDGAVEYVYFGNESTPLRFSRSHAYAELGTYYVVVTAANDVSFRSHREIVSIERDLEYATMTARGVKYLDDAVLFTFEVDMDKTPAMPVEVELEYDANTNETVLLGRKQQVATPLEYLYKFDDYGMYLVLVIVKNNISHVTTEARVQVGENITLVDLAVDKDHVMPSQDVRFHLSVPRGQPITVVMDLGDGESVIVDENGDVIAPDNAVVTTVAPADDEMVTATEDGGSFDAVTQAAVAEADAARERRRRALSAANSNGTDTGVDTNTEADVDSPAVTMMPEAEAVVPEVIPTLGVVEDVEETSAANVLPDAVEAPPQPQQPAGKEPGAAAGEIPGKAPTDKATTTTSTTTTTPAPTPSPRNKDIIVTYRYKNPGYYNVKVNVSNKYTMHVTHLCRQIVVVPERDTPPVCRTVNMALGGQYSESSPIESLRADPVIINSTHEMLCDESYNYVARFYWYGERRTATGEWRPELNICSHVAASPSLVQAGNTLWYGLYRIYGRLAVHTKSSATETAPTLYTYETQPTYLRVRPSPLVANIKGDPKKDIAKFYMLTIAMEESHDPDVVERDNTTGMQFHLFCYLSSQLHALANKSLDDMLAGSVKLENNSANDAAFYEYGTVFERYEKITMLGYDVAFLSGAMTMNESIIFQLYVTKDERVAVARQEVTVKHTNSTGDDFDALALLLASGDTTAALAVMGDMMSSMNSNNDGNNSDDEAEKRKNMRSKLINFLEDVSQKVANVDQLGKTANVLSGITQVKAEVTQSSKESASSALSNIGGKSADLSKKASLNQVTDTAGGMLGCAGNVMDFAEEKEEEVKPTLSPEEELAAAKARLAPTNPLEEEEEEIEPPCCEQYGGLCEWIAGDFECPDREIENLDDIDGKDTVWDEQECSEQQPDDMAILVDWFSCYNETQKLARYAKEKKVTDNAWKATLDIGGVGMSKLGSDADVTIATPNIKMKMAKFESEESKRRRRRKRRAAGLPPDEPAGPKLPASVMALAGSDGGMQVCDTPNQFAYSDSAKDVQGKVLTLNIASTDGSYVSVQDAEPIELWMKGKPNLVPAARNYTSVAAPGEETSMNYHAIQIEKNNTGLHMIIVPENPDDAFDVYVQYMDFPNETYYMWKTVISHNEELDFEVPTGFPEIKLDMLRYTAFVPSNLTSLNGTYRIGVKLNPGTKIKVAEANLKMNFTYSFRVFLSGCRYWDTTNNTWSTDGCQIGPLTTIYDTQCLCTHLTSFGGDFVVPPNTIDFSTVFSLEKFLESMPVFITVIIVLVIYVGTMVWARREDKKDLIKWGATPLEDNLPTDEYHYQMTVYTGVKKHGGTKSKVSFILSGDESDTGARRLFDGKRKELPKGSIYNYILSTEQCLGPLTYLRIWHDNCGKGKQRSWFLDQVQFTDLQTGEKFFFLCDRWLAVEEDDGMVERILPVAGLRDLTAFKHLFNSSVRKKLSNDHMWFSVLSRPTRSNFTRVQRVSCCASLLFLTMITNCMFFKTDEKVKPASIDVGPVSFTLAQLFISIVTTAIVFPPSILIVTIFRKARGKKNTIMQMNQSLSRKSKKFRWRSTAGGGSSLWNNVEQSRSEKFKESLRNILTLHQKAKYETEEPEPEGRKKKKGFSLPHWTMYIAWILVFFSVIAPAFFTILYSMEWGREKSIEWLTTFLLSFFQSVIVVQPVKVLLLAAFISCVLRKPDLNDDEESFDDSNIMSSCEDQMNNSKDRDLQDIIQRRKMAASQVAPPDMASLEKARELRMNELQMEAILKEMIVYFFFLLVIFFLSYQARDSDSFIYADNVKNTFERNSPAYSNIKSPDTFWYWINNTLLPNLYSGEWYNGKKLKWREALQIDDRNTIRVGVGRFRQLRIKDDTCKVQPAFQRFIKHCRNGYNWLDDDAKDYLKGWKLPGDDLPPLTGNETRPEVKEVKHDKKSSWVYRNSVETKTAPYSGAVTMYKGGGYTFNFRRSLRTTKRLMRELEKNEWVDTRTRAVFIEFTLYNANVNLFASCIMVIEFISSGSAVTRSEVKIFRMSSYVGGFGVIVLFFEIVYLVFTLYFLARMIRLLRKERMKYFQDFWNMLEFATLVMGIVAIAMYAMKKLFGALAMKLLEESGSGDYVNFVTISIWDEMFGLVLACVVFVSTIKFIKMLKFNRRMSMLGDTIKLATKDLKMFSITFFIYYTAFCFMGYLLFGSKLPNYGTFAGTFEALFAFALGDFDFEAFEDAHRIMGPVFFFLYVGIVYIGLMGMFLTIIYDAFAQVKANADLRSNDYEIVDFMMRKFKGVFGWT